MYHLFLESDIILPKKSNYGSTLAGSVTCLLTWPEPPPPPPWVMSTGATNSGHCRSTLSVSLLFYLLVYPNFFLTLLFLLFVFQIISFIFSKLIIYLDSFIKEPAISDHCWRHRWTSPKAVVLVQATWEDKWQSQLRCFHGDSDFTTEVAMRSGEMRKWELIGCGKL